MRPLVVEVAVALVVKVFVKVVVKVLVEVLLSLLPQPNVVNNKVVMQMESARIFSPLFLSGPFKNGRSIPRDSGCCLLAPLECKPAGVACERAERWVCYRMVRR